MTAPDQGCPTLPTGWAAQLLQLPPKGSIWWRIPWEGPDVLHMQSACDLLLLFSTFPGAPQHRTESRLLTGAITPAVATHSWLLCVLWGPLASPMTFEQNVHFPASRKQGPKQGWSCGLTPLHLCLPEMRRYVRSLITNTTGP